jgi:two-component system nitrate/nitrite response regulator NarL
VINALYIEEAGFKHIMEKYKILLVDDHQILLEGVSQLFLDDDLFEVKTSSTSGSDAVEHLKKFKYDILITDYELSDMSGLGIVNSAKSVNSDIKVIVLSMHDDPAVVRELLKAGIDAFVLKSDPHISLKHALDKVVAGKKYFSDEISEILVNQLNQEEEVKLLSQREMEIIRLITRDYSTKQIAEILFISEKTVETHRKNILRKTGCNTVVGLVNFAYENRLI